jgi:hypothetical protein
LDQLKTAEEALVSIRANDKIPQGNSEQSLLEKFKAEIAGMAVEIKDGDFVNSGYISTISRLDSEIMSLEEKISGLSNREHSY